jgi:ketosteroid isomerase-like protein
MAHPNVELINRFYTAFARRDAEAMNACYAQDVEFSDPVFVGLKGDEARGMWSMLCGRAADLQVVHSDVEADDNKGSAKWVAHYSFSATGRAVENRIEARFVFKDGLIQRHDDSFDLWRWMRQALGPTGLLMGWAPFAQNKLRKTARAGLDKFLKEGK